jgi:CRISPR/Cas system-associated exonuclease Cas4 (RecB family)
MLTEIDCPHGRRVSIEACIGCGVCYPKQLLAAMLKPLTYWTDDATLRVTQLIGCLRKNYFDRTSGAHVRLDEAYILSRGSLMHYRLLRFFPRRELEIRGDFNGIEVQGHIDAMDDDDNLYELKTVAWMPKKPYNHHMQQLHSYYTMLEMNGIPVGHLRLIYATITEMKVIEIQPMNMHAWISKRARTLSKALRERIPPSVDWGVEDWRCERCTHKTRCAEMRIKAESPPAPSFLSSPPGWRQPERITHELTKRPYAKKLTRRESLISSDANGFGTNHAFCSLLNRTPLTCLQIDFERKTPYDMK